MSWNGYCTHLKFVHKRDVMHIAANDLEPLWLGYIRINIVDHHFPKTITSTDLPSYWNEICWQVVRVWDAYDFAMHIYRDTTCQLWLSVIFSKECVAVLTWWYRKNGAVSCGWFGFIPYCTVRWQMCLDINLNWMWPWADINRNCNIFLKLRQNVRTLALHFTVKLCTFL